MKASILLAVTLFTSTVFAETNPFGEISGNYDVVSCDDSSPTPGSAGYLCHSKTAMLGLLPGDPMIGLRFVDIDYVVFGAKCGDPVICTADRIYAEVQNPEYPGQTLVTDIRFSQESTDTLKISYRRQLLPKLSEKGRNIDGQVDMVLKRRN